eukprot:TRINITY_DN1774_c0_g1_i3.p1 TRINITY_DN1774_c0_g1~~TRINITY_DN1774_c0_g1_i3.p1  ORF type:complete len:799 (+),score=180.69 TRINITY_DN1774_c0_g1_i3:77-2398(+)
MPGGCGRLMTYMRNRMRREGDSEKEAHRKAAFVVFLGSTFLVSLLGLASYPSTAVCSLTFLSMLAWTWVHREITETFLRVSVVLMCACLVYYDALAASLWTRLWPLFVLVIDVLLVMESPRYLTLCVVSAACIWLCVVEFEYGTRTLHLFDLPDSFGYDYRRAKCDCEHPPCAHGKYWYIIINTAPTYLVFILDYFLTRGFADEVLNEKAKMAAAVQAAEDIARSLARFDLEAAARYLENHPELPDELAESLETLLVNLGSYHPYLPTELFRTGGGGSPRASPSDARTYVPGLVDRKVALVFTDIRCSTELWEHSSGTAMEDSLNLQNLKIRQALADNQGYEVKTIGDAFMIAFGSSINAVRFGHAAQTSLANASWPEGLMRPDADDGFAILAVRMGIHCGEAVVQHNNLTGRYDYFGPTANRAARVEPFGAPGAVTVTSEVVADVGGAAVLADTEGFLVVPYAEERSGKGLRTALVLTALLPREVAKQIEPSVRALVGVHVRQESDVLSVVSLKSSLASREVVSEWAGSGVQSAGSGGDLLTFEPMGSWSLRGNRGLFSAALSHCACVGVLRFTNFDFAGAKRIYEMDTYGQEVARTEHRLQAVVAAVQMTHGHVTSVVGGTVWVSWGLHAECTQIVAESARCMVLLRDRLTGERVTGDCTPSFHAGLVTGPLASVELAASTWGRRFVTLFGACVELGAALCTGAAGAGAWVLAAAADGSLPADRHSELKDARRAERWNTREWDVHAYELDVVAMAAAMDKPHSDRADVETM